jgi:putative membrane protein
LILTLQRARRFALALAVLSLACSHFRRDEPNPSNAASTPTAAARGAPSDAEIAAIVLAANNTDISYAKLAPTRAESQAIKDFAARMLGDHTRVNQLVSDLLTALQLTPEDSKTSLDFRDESATKRDLMRELEGRAFDTTYIANEITYHTKLLGAIDSVLLPAARNAQLKQLMTNMRPAVAAHLAHAQQVRAGLAR